jgi:hypothetical protein
MTTSDMSQHVTNDKFMTTNDNLNPILVTVNSRLELSGLPRDLAKKYAVDNTFPNPKRETLERLGKWTGNEPEYITLSDRGDDGTLLLPRGYFPALVSDLRWHDLQFAVKDLTIAPPLRQKVEAKGILYPYQERALSDLLRYQTGVIEAPTGSGKTNILLSAAARLGTPALILVHTTELLRQTCGRIRSWLGIEPGTIQGKKTNLQPVTVAMIQTLSRRNLQEEGIADNFGAVLVDEAHHSPAMTWAAVLSRMPARYKYGFTATAWRKDGMHFLMWRLIGNKTARISREEVEEAGKIVWPEVETIETDYYFDLTDSCDWGQCLLT